MAKQLKVETTERKIATVPLLLPDGEDFRVLGSVNIDVERIHEAQLLDSLLLPIHMSNRKKPEMAVGLAGFVVVPKPKPEGGSTLLT